jgi:UDP-N-acetyl-D-mannosaminuronic acid dehydrogenase
MGYVGIPAAALIADNENFVVIGIQRRSKRSGWKIETLNKGECPIKNEPNLPSLIHRTVVEKKSFSVTDDLSILREMDYILIDVQTPTDETHTPRYESLRQVSHQIGKSLQKNQTVIIESTVAPGTTIHIVQPILEQESGLKAGEDFYLVFSYERVMVGRLIYNIVNYPRIVGGINPKSTEKGIWLYKHIVKEELFPTDAQTAEMAKVVENTYRDVNIAFANEVALACESMGVDVHEVRKFVNSLPFKSNAYRNMHIPGAGVGGHCLPKDPWLLKYGTDTYGKKIVKFDVIEASRYRNIRMTDHMVKLLESALNEHPNLKNDEVEVAVLGVAFLENSDDSRNTPTRDLLKKLEEKNIQYSIHDHLVRQVEFEYSFSNDLDATLTDVDAALVVTKHDIYKKITIDKLKRLMRNFIVIDGRDVFDLEKLKEAGFIVRGVGKPFS